MAIIGYEGIVRSVREQKRDPPASHTRPTRRPLTQLLVSWVTTLCVIRKWSSARCVPGAQSFSLQSVWDRGFLGSSRTRNTRLVPPGVCGSWPLLAVWDRCFLGSPRTPQHALGPSWSVRLLAAPRSVGPRFTGLTANPQHALGPSWSVRLLAAPRSSGPRFTGLVPPQAQQTIAARQHPWRQQYWSFRLLGQSPAPSSCAPCLHRQRN